MASSRKSQETSIRHVLSFDVEEHFQVSAFDSPMRRRNWNQFESRVESSTNRILEVLGITSTKATFFILGWVAERHPRMVRELAEQGHEIASHGYAHQLISEQTPNEFREDVRRARRILEDIIGVPVTGYRAPSFSIASKTRWALSILTEEGYTYDSSIFPVFHDRYGIPGAYPWCHQLHTDSGPLWEVPPSTVKLGWMRVPVAGGGYFRLFPYPMLQRLLKRIERQGHPLVMYLHPWELDPEQPRMNGPMLSRFRHYLNLQETENRLTSLLRDFTFAPLRDVIASIKDGCEQPLSIQSGNRSPGSARHLNS